MTVVDDIKSRLDIVDIISQRVALQRSGKSFKANCPFHQENTPSFHVFPDRQSWRCFGSCATGGDVLSFVMRLDNLEFREALGQLAQQTGVVLSNKGVNPQNETAYKINETTRAFFQRTLASAQGSTARDYLNQRGLNKESIETFEIGLSPTDGESLKNHLIREGYPQEELTRVGVLRRDDNGANHDLFRGRLMFPIRDTYGQLVGFGARTLDGSDPKYLNSAQGPLFDKSRILYGMDRARSDIRKNGAVIVEGYMDAIAAHQAGFTNVVAQMGTALTETQVEEIRRFTGKMTMALDQDAAGQNATLRSLDVVLHNFLAKTVQRTGQSGLEQLEDSDPRVILMPSGQDPDDVIRNSSVAWRQLVDSAVPAITFRINAITSGTDITTPEGKAKCVAEAAPFVHLLGGGIQQANALELLADNLDVPIDTVKASLNRPSIARQKRRSEAQRSGSAVTSPFVKLDHDPVEEHCLQLLIEFPELRQIASNLKVEFFQRHENKQLFARLLNVDPDANREETLDQIEKDADDETARQLSLLLEKDVVPSDVKRRMADMLETVSRLEERNLRTMKTEEARRFAEVPPDLESEDNNSVLHLNQQIKNNEGLRRGRS